LGSRTGNQLFQHALASGRLLASKHVKRRVPGLLRAQAPSAHTTSGVANVVFSFSDLKYFFECRYQFKLRVLYASTRQSMRPLLRQVASRRAGRSDARAIRGDVADAAEVRG